MVKDMLKVTQRAVLGFAKACGPGGGNGHVCFVPLTRRMLWNLPSSSLGLGLFSPRFP